MNNNQAEHLTLLNRAVTPAELIESKTFNKLAGEVEVDESFIGGKTRNMPAEEWAEKIPGRGPQGKTIVAAALERGGTVRAGVCATRRKPELQALVREKVEAGF